MDVANSTETIIHNDPEFGAKSKNIETTSVKKLKFVGTKTILKNLSIFTIVTGYFIWATHFYLVTTGYGLESFNASTCTGYGFLAILYCFFVYYFLYKYVLRPFVLPAFHEHMWLPTSVKLNSMRYTSTIFYVCLLVAVVLYLIFDTADNRNRLIPLSGLVFFLLIGFGISANRKAIKWKTVLWGIILQFLFGLLTIRWEVGRNILQCFGDKINTFLNYAFDGATFTYGDFLVNQQAVFAFKALSTIYFVSLVVNILYYYGVMQKIISIVGSFLSWVMETTICESLNSAANIFLGQSEAPLLLSPYLKHLTDSEIHSVMTSGFATVAGSVMAAYISFGARPQDLITSSIMSAPAALCYSKLIYPETEEIQIHKDNIRDVQVEYESVLDAAAKGVASAIQLVLGIIASLIAFLALVYWANGILAFMGELVGFTDPIWTLDLILGKICIPISYLMGIPWEDCEKVGTLIGLKTMVNEFVAFEKMSTMQLSLRSKVIATYAICGFSNPGSIGIMISAMSGLVPTKREVITRLVLKAFVGGAIVCFMTACIAGVLMPENAL